MSHNKNPILLPSAAFRSLVLERDGGACVCCQKATDHVHMLLDTRLWEDGGRYLDNGVALCQEHLEMVRKTELMPKQLRENAGIKGVLLPPSYVEEENYDCWGNVVRPTGVRYKGELFDEPDIQSWLKAGGFLNDFSPFYKYPSTPHLEWSKGVQRDDRVLISDAVFQGEEVIITEKRDGEGATLYPDYYHARSIDGRHHESRNWLKNFWGKIKHEIPDGWRINGENLYAQHSIGYNDLDTYFEAFFVWNEKNATLPYDETVEYLAMLGIKPVPVLDRFVYDRDRAQAIARELDTEKCEGYVMSLTRSFSYREFRTSVAKFVRQDHVQTNKHWMHQTVVPNQLKKTNSKESLDSVSQYEQ